MGKRIYELYTWGPGCSVTNQGKCYRTGMWVLKVRAMSIKQAYYLASSGQVAHDKGLGIVGAGNSHLAPSKDTPWGVLE